MKHKAKRIGCGKYEYRGLIVCSVGYYPPEKRICWEVVDHDGSCFAHAFSLRESKNRINQELDNPKAGIVDEGLYRCYCGTFSGEPWDICPRCGQRLDWSE